MSFPFVVAMGSIASPTAKLAAVYCDGFRLRGAVPRESAVGPSQSPGADARFDLDVSLLHW